MLKLRGCGTALVTPFKSDGSIDEKALRSLVEWQVESKIDFLVPCGTTGETPTLSHDEWLRVIDITIEVVNGRVPIVAGATSNSTREAVSKSKEVASRRGVDAILSASPYYNKPTQEGQYQHFKAIAEAVDKPIMLYNVPGRTAVNIEVATLGATRRVEKHRCREGSQRQHHADCRSLRLGTSRLFRSLWRRRYHLAGNLTRRRRNRFRCVE